MWRISAPCVLTVESRSEIMQIEGDPMRLVGARGAFDESRPDRDAAHQVELAGIDQP